MAAENAHKSRSGVQLFLDFIFATFPLLNQMDLWIRETIKISSIIGRVFGSWISASNTFKSMPSEVAPLRFNVGLNFLFKFPLNHLQLDRLETTVSPEIVSSFDGKEKCARLGVLYFSRTDNISWLSSARTPHKFALHDSSLAANWLWPMPSRLNIFASESAMLSVDHRSRRSRLSARSLGWHPPG